jgi:hypothetical protein
MGKWTMGLMGSLGLLALGAPVRADDDLQKVQACMQANVPPTLQMRQMELESTDKTGATRLLRGRLYAMRDDHGPTPGLFRATLRIEAPDYLAGAAYLVREGAPGGEDEMYVFLPSVHRVRRVVGDAGYDSMLGTNFSYIDFKQLEGAFAGVPATLEAPQTLEQGPAWVVSFKAQPGNGGGYTQIRSWVDQRSCTTVKVDFYEGAKVRKELTVPADALKQSERYWYPARAIMRDLREGTSTELRILGVNSSAELPGELFDAQQFHVAK